MAYLSLYRKYRPQFFADVVGQDHVVQTLQNALRSGHVANGYLFCGTRGVAKTTMARILAKGLNCLGSDGKATKPQREPCNECAACKSISSGQAVDVVELDAASNRSVNDIAKLRESVQFGPMEYRFKVYIVDEAHQLSSDAKDAFLKTLEEPPANVVFILATTETHAIPITIASRCQRFDFKRGSIAQIGQQVSRVLGKENVSMHGDAIVLVARAADGSYRDALSLLDQVLAYKRGNITSDDVAEVLGTVKSDLLASTVDKIADSDFAGIFAISEEIFNQGKDVRQFLKTLAVRFRDMLFLSSGARSHDDDQTFSDPILRQQTSRFSPASLMDALAVITEAERETRSNNQHRLLLEMALLKLSNVPAVSSEVAQSTSPIAKAPVEKPVPVSAPGPSPVFDLVAQVTAEESELQEATDSTEEQDTETIPMFGLDNQPAKLPPSRRFEQSYAQTSSVEAEERELIANRSADLPTVNETQPGSDIPPELRYLQEHWIEAVNLMRATSPGAVPLMNDATPISLVGQVITLEFKMSTNIDKLSENPKRLERVQEVVNKALKKPPKTFTVRAVLHGTPSPTAVGVAQHARQPKPEAAPILSSVPDDSPSDLLDEVIAVFGGRIIEDDNYKR